MKATHTWLSLLGFLVTFPTLHALREHPALSHCTARRFREALTLLAVGTVLIGTAHHLSVLFELRRRRSAQKHTRALDASSRSLAIVVALSLVMDGVVISGMAYAIERFL